MKIIFFGTSNEAARLLEALLKNGHEILSVVTQPDRPKGRGLKLVFSPVKELALKNNLPLEQPEKIKGNPAFTARLKSLRPKIGVIAAYGKILPREIIDLPELGIINVHASLLPKYRGAAPIQWAILNGEKETGVTIMKISETLDAGGILMQEKIRIEDDDTSITLSKKLFEKGEVLLIDALKQMERGELKPIPQNEAQASYAPALTKESGLIDWKKPAVEIHNRIRALLPWPAAHTSYKKKLLKMLKSNIQVADLETKFKLPGTVVQIVKNIGFIAATGKGHLLVTEVQPEGKKNMGAYNFAIGNDLKAGETLPS